MKFRAATNDLSAMREFMNVSNIVARICKQCVMRITKTKIYFIISNDDGGPKRPLAWCELLATYYFKDYTLVGLSDEHDEIYLELSAVVLSNALSMLRGNAKLLKIKLTDKGTPCLTLVIDLLSDADVENKNCMHDLKVEIISRKYWDNYEEPIFTDFHVSIEMPKLRMVKIMAERMKNVSHCLTIAACKNGRLTLKIKTNMATLCAHFPNLAVQSFTEQLQTINTDESINDRNTVSADIDIKKFLMFLSGMQINNSRTTCNIIHEKMVKLYMEQPGALSIQIFLSQLTI